MADMFRQRKGFTLSELLVSAAIMAVLAGVAIPMAKIAVKRGKEIDLQRSLRQVREAIDEYKRMADQKKIETDDDTSGYPPSLDVLVKGATLKEEAKVSDKGQSSKGSAKIMKFLRRIPKDPMTDSFDWGLRSSEDAPDSTSWGGKNVYDIYTKSNKTALDGSKYRDW